MSRDAVGFHFVMWRISSQARHMVRTSGWNVIVNDKQGFSRRETFCIRAGSRQAASKFLNPLSLNLKKLPQMTASVFLNHSGRNWLNPDCSFYLPVSMSRKTPVASRRGARESVLGRYSRSVIHAETEFNSCVRVGCL